MTTTGERRDEATLYGRLDAALARHGLSARGGIRFNGDGPVVPDGRRIDSLVLVGHVGSSFWPYFETFAASASGPDPLDRWSRHVVGPIADAFGGTALYPFEKPWWPFQRWIAMGEGLKASPLGILVHPEYGLWHGYRAAIEFERRVDIPVARAGAHPCDDCPDRPCIAACPVGAVAMDRFDVGTCRHHLAGAAGGAGCMRQGCLSRNACPVGRRYRYRPAHLRFHMNALERPVGI